MLILSLLAVGVCPTGQQCLSSHGTHFQSFFIYPYSKDALQSIATFRQLCTIEKWMGYDVKDVDDEGEMVLPMKGIKKVNPM